MHEADRVPVGQCPLMPSVRPSKDCSMNYGEELTYWYLRLNGFFPISNFVVHKSQAVAHTTDVDVLAVRPPFVYEEVGGQPDDWDPYLANGLQFGRQIGLICEVKTGTYEEARLFRSEQMRYTLPRLGLVAPADFEKVLGVLSRSPQVEVNGGAVVAKLFVASTVHAAGQYLSRSLNQIEDFLVERVRRYPIRKYADRMFFPSHAFQLIIAQVHRAIEQRSAV